MLSAAKLIPRDAKLSVAWGGSLVLVTINIFVFLLLYGYIEPLGAFLQEWVNTLRLTKIFKLNWGSNWLAGIFATVGDLVLLLMWIRVLEILSGGISFIQKQQDGSFQVVSFPYFLSRRTTHVDFQSEGWSLKQNPVEALLGEGVWQRDKVKVRLRLDSDMETA